MATDGSLKFDTKINTEGFENGISTLTKSVERLTVVMEKIADRVTSSFTGVAKSSSQVSDGIDEVVLSAKAADGQIKLLEEELKKFEATPKNAKMSDMEKYRKKITEVEQIMEQLLNKREALESQLLPEELPVHSSEATQAIYENNEEWQKLSQKIEAATILLSKYNEEQEKVAAAHEIARLQKEKASTFTGKIHHYNDPEPVTPNDNNDGYINNTNTVIQKNRELEAVVKQTSATVQAETEKEERSLVGQRDSMLYALDVFKRLPGGIIHIFKSAESAIDGSKNKIYKTQMEIRQYSRALKEAKEAGYALGDKQYDTAYIGLAKAKKKAEEYQKSLLKVDNNQKKAGKSAKALGNKLKKTGSDAQKTGKKLTMLSMLGRSVLFSIVFRGISMISKAFTEGLSNLAMYSDATNKSMSMLMSANTRLKNSFATAFSPALEAAAPALKRIVDLLSAGATHAGQFLAALTGKSTFVKAVDVEEDYAESIKDSNAALKEQEKANKKLTFSFDNLIQAKESSSDSGYTGPTPDQMFETVEVSKDIQTFAELVKGILSDLFAPMKKSWDTHGSYAITASKNALNSLKKLAGDIGASFLKVWNDEGYGQKISSDLIITFGNLAQTVANLADRFDEAWLKADNGTNIIRHLGDILLTISGLFREASERIKDWASELNFEPLLKSFDNVLVRLNPVVKIIGQALLWLLSNALLPFSKWALECGVPKVLDLIAAGLEVLASVLTTLTPLASWLWDSFLQPLGQWAGTVFISALQKIVEWLSRFSDWVNTHQSAVESITIAVLAFFAAWKFTEFVSGLGRMFSTIPTLLNFLTNLDWKFGAVVAVIGSIIYLAAQVARAWDKMTPGEKVVTAIIAVAGALALIVALMCYYIKDLPGVFLAGSIAAIAGISLAGIASSANQRSSSTISGGHGGGGRPFSMDAPAAFSGVSYRTPRLATGTVVPPRAGEFAAILGDNNRETEIVSPLSTMEQALDNVLKKYMGDGGSERPIHIEMIVDGQRFASAVYRANNKETQRVGVRLVGGT